MQRFRRGDSFSFEIQVKHYNLWIEAQMPVFLVLYDAREKKGILALRPGLLRRASLGSPKKGAKTLTVHIPFANEFTEDTIDYMWGRKAAILAQLKGTEHHG